MWCDGGSTGMNLIILFITYEDLKKEPHKTIRVLVKARKSGAAPRYRLLQLPAAVSARARIIVFTVYVVLHVYTSLLKLPTCFTTEPPWSLQWMRNHRLKTKQWRTGHKLCLVSCNVLCLNMLLIYHICLKFPPDSISESLNAIIFLGEHAQTPLGDG